MEGIVGMEVQRVFVDSTCCVRTIPAPRIEWVAGPEAERFPAGSHTGSTLPQPLHVLQHPAGDAISSAKLDRLTPRPDLAIHSATVDNISIYAEHDSISSAVHTFAGDEGVGDKHLRSLSGPIQISARELSTTWVRRKFLLKE